MTTVSTFLNERLIKVDSRFHSFLCIGLDFISTNIGFVKLLLMRKEKKSFLFVFWADKIVLKTKLQE